MLSFGELTLAPNTLPGLEGIRATPCGQAQRRDPGVVCKGADGAAKRGLGTAEALFRR